MTAPRSEGDPQLDLPLWEIVQTAHLAERAFNAAFAAAGLTPGQFGVLVSLIDEPDLTMAQLARNTLVRPQTVARHVDGLLADGLITVDGPRGRGRPSRLRVTDTGRARVDAAWPAVITLNAPATTGLSTAATVTLCEQLRHLRHSLNAAAED